MTRKCACALSDPRSDVVLPPTLRQKENVRDLRHFCHLKLAPEDRIVRRDFDDGVVILWKHAADLRLPMRPGRCAPEVVRPEKAAFQQVGPQPLRFLRCEPDRAGVRHHRDRTIEQRIVGEPHDPGVGLPVLVAADRRPGQLGEARQEIHLGVRVVRRPSDAHLLEARTLVHDPAERERPVGHHARRESRWNPALAESPLLGVACGHERQQDKPHQERTGADLRAGPEPHEADCDRRASTPNSQKGQLPRLRAQDYRALRRGLAKACRSCVKCDKRRRASRLRVNGENAAVRPKSRCSSVRSSRTNTASARSSSGTGRHGLRHKRTSGSRTLRFS